MRQPPDLTYSGTDSKRLPPESTLVGISNSRTKGCAKSRRRPDAVLPRVLSFRWLVQDQCSDAGRSCTKCRRFGNCRSSAQIILVTPPSILGAERPKEPGVSSQVHHGKAVIHVTARLSVRTYTVYRTDGKASPASDGVTVKTHFR